MPKSLALLLISLIAPVFGLGQTSPLDFSLPGKTGSVRVDAKSWQFRDAQFKDDAAGFRLVAQTDHRGVMITIFLEKAAKAQASMQDVRAAWWPEQVQSDKRIAPISRQRTFESEPWAIGEYYMDQAGGMPVHQLVWHAYAPDGDLWIDVHLSKTGYEQGDEKELSDALSRIQLVPEYAPGPRDYVGYATWFYRKGAYKSAAPLYEQALALDKQRPTLGKGLERMVTDNLGMSYGISGNLEKSKQLFEVAIQQDPDYPLYYYNLACAYGEMKDMQGAMKYLAQAFDHRANVLPGERMPDPGTDSSFSKFMKNAEFTKFLATLPKQ